MTSEKNDHVLVAPLNWGLGHASRCIPIIRELQINGYTPILASDGDALELLRKEFPDLLALELPSYHIEYPADAAKFKWKMIKSTPRIYEALLAERKQVKQWVKQYNLCGIISDNRLGVFSKKVPSVFITHQLNVLTGNTTWFSTKLHRMIIKKFVECWVPDSEEDPNLSGKLGHLSKPHPEIRYIGTLSRLEHRNLQKKYDLLIVLSGPEPQRTLLEVQLREQVQNYKGSVLFVCGKVAEKQDMEVNNNITFYNYMTSGQLEEAINQSEMVLCRSGYSSVMDLAKLRKKCFFIPTPGQFEQEYLAERLQLEQMAPYCEQHEFDLDKLTQADDFTGLSTNDTTVNWKHLFCLFERK